jgi:hypothetical protein
MVGRTGLCGKGISGWDMRSLFAARDYGFNIPLGDTVRAHRDADIKKTGRKPCGFRPEFYSLDRA